MLEDRDKEWSKWHAIKKHLNNYDWIFWVDADVMIIDKHNKLENLIKLAISENIVIGNLPLKSNVGKFSRLLHTGAFLIKNDKRSFNLIDRMINANCNLRSLYFDRNTATLDEGYLYELYVTDNYVNKMFKIIPGTMLTSILRQNHPMYFSVHFAGMMPIDKKLLCMAIFADRFSNYGYTYINNIPYNYYYNSKIDWDEIYNYKGDHKNPIFTYGSIDDINEIKDLSNITLRTSDTLISNIELLKSFRSIIFHVDDRTQFIKENIIHLSKNNINFHVELAYKEEKDIFELFENNFQYLEIGINLLFYPKESISTGECFKHSYFDYKRNKMLIDNELKDTFMGWMEVCYGVGSSCTS